MINLKKYFLFFILFCFAQLMYAQPPINDNVCNAIALQVDGSINYFDNSEATIEDGEISPPTTGCQSQDGWCNSIISNTMWFTFQAPVSGNVEINTCYEGSFDTQIAVWQSADCVDYSTFSFIAGNDDIQNGCEDAVYASKINLSNLIPGFTYLIQMDSYQEDFGQGYYISISDNFVGVVECGTVSNLSTDLVENGYSLNWDPLVGSNLCELSGGKTSSNRTFSKIISGFEISTYYVNEKFLKANTNYFWQVKCNCASNDAFGSISEINYFTTGNDLDFGFPKSNNQNIFADESNMATTSTTIKLFPNPAKESFTITTALENYNLELTDITGKLVCNQKNINQTSFNLDIKQIEAGSYFVKISNANASEVIKLMVN